MSQFEDPTTHSDFSELRAVRRKIEMQDAPHRDAQVLHYLYHKAGMSIPEIADRLDVSSPAVWYQMDYHDIERRSVADAMTLHHLRK